jgi:SAM-dependent methyltransferase
MLKTLSSIASRFFRRRPSALHVKVPLLPDRHYNEVLRAEADIEEAIRALQWEHPTRTKTWDLLKAAHAVIALLKPETARILDAGCVGSPILEVLHGHGYRDLWGCDFTENDLPQVPGLKFWKRDLTKTEFPAASFDAVTCLSVVEHGVPLHAFFSEMQRLLKPSGYLLVSIDYHDPKIPTEDVDRRYTFGLPWQIFSKTEVEAAVLEAEKHGFRLLQPIRWEQGPRPPVTWNGKRYTFLFLALQKESAPTTEGSPS